MRGPIQSAKLSGIQYLRAIAALMVAYLHMSVQIPQYSPMIRDHLPFDTHQLNSAVDIFFVISGFIMMISSAGSRPGDFAIRRVIRVAPSTG
jgi:exopolysaccharide production protein ExoZ